tara:strand:+ start:1054 stop:1674 length:621 start_codon:yes stop_codon:yes gene_type:complete
MPWDKLRKLWPDWRPNDIEAITYRNMLQQYSPAIAKEAVSQLFKAEGRWRRPDLGKLEDAIKELSKKTKRPSRTKFFYIGFICTMKGKKEAGYYEQFDWVATWDDLEVSWQVPAENHLAEHCNRYQNEHGGTWMYILTDDYRQIRRKAREFREEEPEEVCSGDELPRAMVGVGHATKQVVAATERVEVAVSNWNPNEKIQEDEIPF